MNVLGTGAEMSPLLLLAFVFNPCFLQSFAVTSESLVGVGEGDRERKLQSLRSGVAEVPITLCAVTG